jgi:hypothetical protein
VPGGDRRSSTALRYRQLYKTAQWSSIRKQQLSEHPLCARHLSRSLIVPATVVHHKEPHRGDRERFFSGPFESLCKACHDGPTQSAERLGYSNEIGDDGWPVDAKHPANRKA